MTHTQSGWKEERILGKYFFIIGKRRSDRGFHDRNFCPYQLLLGLTLSSFQIQKPPLYQIQKPPPPENQSQDF